MSYSARMRLGPIQIFLVPLGLVLSIILISTGLRHTSVQETSPIMGSAEAVQRWADQESRVKECLRWSIDVDTIDQDARPAAPGEGHWFATLRCSHRSIYVQWVILIIGPWLFMNLVLLALMRMIPEQVQNDDHAD
ncbi:hypothetical protein [Sphingomonas sp. MMS24-J13]|uniref:hypothetical protein n=1 Tax=Sphingomonas sp. MMS24-J13 TaxID=3238686 RepID=UPI00384BF54B